MFPTFGGWRYVGYLFAIIALGVPLWWVKGRIDKSYQVEGMKVELMNAKLDVISLQSRVRAAEQDRLALSIKLGDARYLLDLQAKKATQRVKVVVKDKPGCSLDYDAISLLNDARRANYDLPITTGGASSATETAAKN